MEQVVPWARLIERLRSLYPKGERGRPPIGLERMLRVYFLQQWYGLADEALEDALYDSQALRSFAGIELNRDPVPDATTVLHFRHWLEAHKLTEALFAEVNALLAERGLLLRQGTIVDATIIAAPSSTKNKQKSRDPEMHQTKKGNQWYFGMKVHIGADLVSGIVHSLTGTAANEADINQMGSVLHGEEKLVFADAGYTGAEARPEHEDRDVSPACAGAGSGTLRPSVTPSRHCRLMRGRRPRRSSGCWRSCAPRSSILSMSSKICSVTGRCATAACTRILPSFTPCSRWPTWSSPRRPFGWPLRCEGKHPPSSEQTANPNRNNAGCSLTFGSLRQLRKQNPALFSVSLARRAAS
jgi:IS5 family transposase